MGWLLDWLSRLFANLGWFSRYLPQCLWHIEIVGLELAHSRRHLALDNALASHGFEASLDCQHVRLIFLVLLHACLVLTGFERQYATGRGECRWPLKQKVDHAGGCNAGSLGCNDAATYWHCLVRSPFPSLPILSALTPTTANKEKCNELWRLRTKPHA